MSNMKCHEVRADVCMYICTKTLDIVHFKYCKSTEVAKQKSEMPTLRLNRRLNFWI